jgi:hypothetical protein
MLIEDLLIMLMKLSSLLTSPFVMTSLVLSSYTFSNQHVLLHEGCLSLKSDIYGYTSAMLTQPGVSRLATLKPRTAVTSQ